jgi:streptogramin lyase
MFDVWRGRGRVSPTGLDGVRDGQRFRRTPASRPLRVFLSHTSELRERPRGRSFVDAAETAVLRARHAVTNMAYFTARESSVAQYCIDEVGRADVYVGILGHRYGSTVRDRPACSYVELEFGTATQRRVPRLIFLIREDRGPLPSGQSLDYARRQGAFRERLAAREDLTVAWIDTPEDLEIRLYQALVELPPRRATRRWWPALASALVVVAAIGWAASMHLPPTDRTAAPVQTPAPTPAPVLAAPAIAEYPPPSGKSRPVGIAAAPDGSIWFAELDGNRIGRVSPTGMVTEYPLPAARSDPLLIAAGPDGNLWFTERMGNRIGRITPAGSITEFRLPTPDSQPIGIAPGPDGAVWFVEQNGNRLGRITPTGDIREFAVPTPAAAPDSIVTGPDGNLWFTEHGAGKIGRMTRAGKFREFPLRARGAAPAGLTSGPDGAIWFTEESGNRIGRVTLSGSITEFPIPRSGSDPIGIVTGPDGNLWFAELVGGHLGRITPRGAISELPLTPGSAGPIRLAVGADGDLWFTASQGGMIERVSRSSLG